ncbi:hypothetical protein GDS87_19350 [Lysinibacillus pakistanensis]|uniref:Uncharacterized protein n=1 Tax=Lysinibacillus pakistanensis TaxID=759811 RepID=A0ABX6DGM7_9BACI|nr:hypothetical protein GDS87_19350 [Lysinibacillus pakistanensis]
MLLKTGKVIYLACFLYPYQISPLDYPITAILSSSVDPTTEGTNDSLQTLKYDKSKDDVK